MDRRVWQAIYSPWGHKESDMTTNTHTHRTLIIIDLNVNFQNGISFDCHTDSVCVYLPFYFILNMQILDLYKKIYENILNFY